MRKWRNDVGQRVGADSQAVPESGHEEDEGEDAR